MYIQTKDTERNNSVHHRMGHSNQEVNVRLGTGMFCVEAMIVYVIHTDIHIVNTYIDAL